MNANKKALRSGTRNQWSSQSSGVDTAVWSDLLDEDTRRLFHGHICLGVSVGGRSVGGRRTVSVKHS